MRLTSHSDYSLRVLIYLALNGDRRSNASEIALRFRISRNHLVKVIHGLARGGFIRSYQGKGGGIVLARPAEQINLGRVVRYTEGPMEPVECFRSHNRCVITSSCRLAVALQEASDCFLEVLDRFSLADIMEKRTGLMRLLKIEPKHAVARSRS